MDTTQHLPLQGVALLVPILIVSFFIGAIPFAYLFVKKLKGVDIRSVGSGNVGATNAARALGSRWWGVLILLLDALKGAVPVMLATYLVVGKSVWAVQTPAEQAIALGIGIAAFLGHCYNPFLGFKGGKGVATALGVFLVLTPLAALTTLVICLLIIAITRYVSVASITGSILLPVSIYAFAAARGRETPWVYVGATIVIGALIVLRHRTNIRRLVAGTEAKS